MWRLSSRLKNSIANPHLQVKFRPPSSYYCSSSAATTHSHQEDQSATTEELLKHDLREKQWVNILESKNKPKPTTATIQTILRRNGVVDASRALSFINQYPQEEIGTLQDLTFLSNLLVSLTAIQYDQFAKHIVDRLAKCRFPSDVVVETIVTSLSPSTDSLKRKVLGLMIETYIEKGLLDEAVGVVLLADDEARVLFSLGSWAPLLREILKGKKFELFWKVLGAVYDVRVPLYVYLYSHAALGHCVQPDSVSDYYFAELRAKCGTDIVTDDELRTAAASVVQILHGSVLAVDDTGSPYGRYDYRAVSEYVMLAFCKNRSWEELQATISEMAALGLDPGRPVYNVFIHGLMIADRIEECFKMRDEMVTSAGIREDLYTFNRLIQGVCKIGKMEEAEKLVNEMIGRGFKPDLITHTSLTECYIEQHNMEAAIDAFERMKKDNLAPLRKTYLFLVHGLCKCGKAQHAGVVYREMVAIGMEPDPLAYKALIAAHYREGNIEESTRLYQELDAQTKRE